MSLAETLIGSPVEDVRRAFAPATSWRFGVSGLPVTQGSMRAFVVRGRAHLVHTNAEELDPWRKALGLCALAMRGSAPMLTGPVVVELVFALVKPASTPKRRRTWPIRQRSGDVDKFARACLDAFTGVFYIDDAQVVRLTVEKDWATASGPGVLVKVYERPFELC